MSPVPADTLPDLLTLAQLGQMFGLSERTMRRLRERRDWPYSPAPGFPAKGKRARYNKAQVLLVASGQRLRQTSR